MTQVLITLDDIRAACLEDDPTGWRALARMYGPLAQHLASHYFKDSKPAVLLKRVFVDARAGDFLRGVTSTGQKDFLLPWRRHVMAVGRAARGATPETPLTHEKLPDVLKGFPQLQQTMLLWTLRGYSPKDAGVLAKSSAVTVEKVRVEALVALSRVLEASVHADFFSRDHDAVFAPLENERGEECLDDHFFVHFEDGGTTTWRDRDRAERHFHDCVPCLIRFSDYRETHQYFRTLPHLEEAAVAEISAELGFPVEPLKKKSLWRRVWGG